MEPVGIATLIPPEAFTTAIYKWSVVRKSFQVIKNKLQEVFYLVNFPSVSRIFCPEGFLFYGNIQKAVYLFDTGPFVLRNICPMRVSEPAA